MVAQTDKLVWITGASSGLGRSLALAMVNQGNRVIASARNREELERLAELDTNIVAIDCDITDESSLHSAVGRILRVSPHLDQVILNAGNCEYLDFPEPDSPTSPIILPRSSVKSTPSTAFSTPARVKKWV